MFEDSDLVLLELDFPGLDGLEVCRGIRSFSSLRNKLGSSGWIITVRGVGFRLGTLEEAG